MLWTKRFIPSDITMRESARQPPVCHYYQIVSQKEPGRMNPDRRMFILAGGSALLQAQTAPSDQITMGVIGSGGRGTFVMTVFQKNPSVRVGAICDVYEPNLENALSVAAKAGS